MISSSRPWLRAIVAILSVVMLPGCDTSTPDADNLASTAASSAATASPAPPTTSTPTPRPTTSSKVKSPTTTATTQAPTSTTDPDSQEPEPTGTGPLPTDLSGAVYGDLASLAAGITTPTGSTRPYLLTVSDGFVVEVMEVYQP